MNNIQNLAKYLVMRNALLKAFKIMGSEVTVTDNRYLRNVEYKIIIYKTLIKTRYTPEQLALLLSILPADLNKFLEVGDG